MSVRGMTITLHGAGKRKDVTIPTESIDFVLGAVASSLRRQHRASTALEIEAAYREVIWQSPEQTERDNQSHGKADT